jgi:hypothetical protein
MGLVKQKHLNLYKRYTEQLIDDLGSAVVFVRENVQSQCGNCIYDVVHKSSSGNYNGTGPKPFAKGTICPVCKNAGTIKTQSSSTVTCTVNYINPNTGDEKKKVAAGDEEQLYCKIKAKVGMYATITGCDHMLIDGVRFRLVNIIKRGLKENVTCIALCKQDK